MSVLDWLVLAVTIAGLIGYGLYRSRARQNQTMSDYLLAGQSLPWYHVCLSVMATQASAITFLSAPGQGFTDGMRFVQFYFGLPLAMVVLSVTFVPIFHRLKVYTAYEFLEQRFDGRVRLFTAGLFLLQRGLSTGISIYAPALILSTLLGWNLYLTNVLMGGIVLLYTVSGGTRAVSYTHVAQMLVITLALVGAGWLVVHNLPEGMGLGSALHVAGKAGKLNLIDLNFDPGSRYNVWSGLIGGFFLQLSYFGTDQSQVGRYLTGGSVAQSRLGLLMNGLLKVPMQFGIILVGVLVFVFYIFNPSPVYFNELETAKLEKSPYAAQYHILETEHQLLTRQRLDVVAGLEQALRSDNGAAVDTTRQELRETETAIEGVRKQVTALVRQNNPAADTSDVNYVFLRFVLDHLPHGLIGLLMAVIFMASMGSLAAAYTSLASTTVVDVFRRPERSDAQGLRLSRWATIGWGLFCIVVAQFANRMGSLIEAVNVLGSIFYGTILGIFVVAFYFKRLGGRATFIGALGAQALVLACWWFDLTAFLWLNLIGCVAVVVLAWGAQRLFRE